jgi:hypothetical protein
VISKRLGFNKIKFLFQKTKRTHQTHTPEKRAFLQEGEMLLLLNERAVYVKKEK